MFLDTWLFSNYTTTLISMNKAANTEQKGIDREIRKPVYKRIAWWMWFFTIAGVIGVGLLFFILSLQNLPTFEELENPKSNQASEVYAANGEVLGRYYIENRIPVSFEELSPNLVQALIATEDERYYQHSGIDGEGLARVLGKGVLLGQRGAGGASTITQQLAKMLFTERPGSGLERVIQKFKEWIIAVKLERSYTKDEIMAMYLNKFNFINGAYGIKAAAEIYFGQSQDSLRIEQAATLVGMLKNPALFNPIRRPDTTKHRRMVVLKQMQKNDIITQAEYDSLRMLPLDMGRFNRKTHADGLAPYFRMELRKELNRILSRDECRKTDGSKYNIFSDGIKVYTTLDPITQKHAEEAMVEHMTQLQKKFWKTWKDKDPWNYHDPEKEPEENERVIKAAQKALRKDIQESERYLLMRRQLLEEEINTISKEIDGFKLRDVDIQRMLDEEKEKGALTKLVSRKLVGTRLAVKYRKVMESPNWRLLKRAYRNFQKEVDRVFNEPIPMKVFAYNAQMEKDTVLSPLDSIRYHRMFLQLGSMAVDPVTGHVKAWVGGINHRYFQYDHVTSLRQVGSTFKPFVYATAIAQQGISPCFTVYDLPYTIHVGEGNFNLLEDWTPSNAGGEYSGEPFTLFRGLMYSKNTVSVFLMKQLGDVNPVRTLVSNMGLSKDLIPPQPSICLGSSDLTVQQLTGAYTTFANNGMYNKPVFILRIEDKNGRLIYQEEPEERLALHPNPNYVMLHMLKRVMAQGLPGFGGVKSELGGKTGTTNDYVDGWFVGITPDLVVGTWVGGDQNWIRFRTLADGIGARMARPFFARLLKRLENDPEADYNVDARFAIPSGDIGIVIDCEEYNDDYGGRGSGDEFFNDEENENFGDDIFGDEEEPVPDSIRLETEENEEF